MVLNSIVGETLARSQARVHAFCWMTNHLHALVQISDIPLAPIMQRIAMRYARYRHRRLETTGHLFERRYGARFINDDAYFLTVLRYIHLNPCKANLVVDPTDYPWSSHGAYLGRRSGAVPHPGADRDRPAGPRRWHSHTQRDRPLPGSGNLRRLGPSEQVPRISCSPITVFSSRM